MNIRRLLTRSDDAATPVLLPILLAATLAMVGAVAIIGLTDSDWADVGAVALLLGTVGLVLGAIRRQLRDGEPDGDIGRSDDPRGVRAIRSRLVTAENRKWWTLVAVGFGLFMIMLDNTVVNVALPTIQRDLGAKLSELEWIVSGYALTFAALMLTGGKLADLFGRRRLFVIGLAVFSGASLACALAPSPGFLIGARVVQGVGAALMNPATLSIISAAFPPRQRGTAIGIWAGVAALAL